MRCRAWPDLLAVILLILILPGGRLPPAHGQTGAAPTANVPAAAAAAATSVPHHQPLDPARLVAAARGQIGVTVGYDPAYRPLPYPGGDVPLATGVCTDVVTRACREQGLDLQRAVHEDMRRGFARYPQRWNLRTPDPNIDHRRVPNLMTFFQRRGAARPITARAEDYRPGDIVCWSLGGGAVTHIGIVSDRRTSPAAGGTPLIIHNIGGGTQEEDLLFVHKIIGHYRLAQP